jgi:hypothetical protein
MDGYVSADVEDAALCGRLIGLRGIHGIGVLMVVVRLMKAVQATGSAYRPPGVELRPLLE